MRAEKVTELKTIVLGKWKHWKTPPFNYVDKDLEKVVDFTLETLKEIKVKK